MYLTMYTMRVHMVCLCSCDMIYVCAVKARPVCPVVAQARPAGQDHPHFRPTPQTGQWRRILGRSLPVPVGPQGSRPLPTPQLPHHPKEMTSSYYDII